MSEGTIEHRTNFRPPTPVPGLSSRLDSMMEALAKKKQWNLIAHGSMVSFTLICIAIVWWSISFRLPQLEQDSVELRQVNQLRNQLEQLRLKENTGFEKGLLTSIRAHEKELFKNKKEVVNWLRQQIKLAHQQEMSLRYSLAGIKRALITHHAMAIRLHIQVNQNNKQSNYARLIRFVERMRHHGTPMHIHQVSMQGGGQGVSAMDMQITVWML